MSDDTKQNLSNVHDLPLELSDQDTSKAQPLADEYDEDKKETLLNISDEEPENESKLSEIKVSAIAIVILAVLMGGGYFGYDYYIKQKLEESVATISGIETSPPAQSTVETSKPELQQQTVKAENELLALIDNSTSTSINPEQSVQTAILIPEAQLVSVTDDILDPLDPQSQATTIQQTSFNTVNAISPKDTLESLTNTLADLMDVTKSLKMSVSDLNFKIDQGAERHSQAVSRIEALEKRLSGRPAATSSNTTKPKARSSNIPTRAQQWVDQANVVSIRKIGSQFIAKVSLPSGIKRFIVGDQHKGWQVTSIDLDSGELALKNKNKQQRTLTL